MRYTTKYFFSLLIAAFSLVACNNNDDEAPSTPSNSTLLVGTWRGTVAEGTIETDSGELPDGANNDPEDISETVLDFREDGTYIEYEVDENGNLTEINEDAWTLEGNTLIMNGLDDEGFALEGGEGFEVTRLTESNLDLFVEASGDFFTTPVTIQVTFKFEPYQR